MTTPVSAAPGSSMQVSRLFPAPPERVFEAWTTPAQILKWLGPPECQALAAEVDLRVGGGYRFRMKTESFGEVEILGVFHEIAPPSKLVYTWNWHGHEALGFGETTVTVQFTRNDAGTQVTITQTGFPNAETAENHTYGWTGSFGKLEMLLGCTGGAATPCPPSGRFVWNELHTSDVTAAGGFYQALLGWEPAPAPMGPMPYTLLRHAGKDVAGMMRTPMEGTPPQWVAYLAVDDAAAVVAKTAALGGRVIAPPFAVPNVGTIAVIADPQGAVFGILQPRR